MAWRMLVWLALAEFMAMTMWFSATAVTPALMAEFHFTSTRAAWLTMGVQAGFVAGTFLTALLNLADLISARWLFAFGCVGGALANAALTQARTADRAILWRLMTGAMLAWVYPPAMKIAASWFQRQRGAALGILIGALTIGSALPHLLATWTSQIEWRNVMMLASVLALTGAVIAIAVIRDGPYLASTSRFDARAIVALFRNRGARLATLGYLGHMWELYAMWTWLAVFATASLSQTRAPGMVSIGSMVAFGAISAGAVGCAIAGFVADRIGKARVAGLALVTSASCAALSGFAFGAPLPVLYALVLVWGCSVVADSAQFSAMVTEFMPRDQVGTALTIQTCSGFLLTMASIQLLPVVASVLGWRWVFLVLVPGPLLGTLAMVALVRMADSTVASPRG